MAVKLELANPVVRQISGITIVYAGVGECINNDQLLKEFATRNRWNDAAIAEADKTMANAGITHRYRPFDRMLYTDSPGLLREEVIGACKALTRLSLDAHKLDKVDVLYLVTSFPPDQKSQWAQEVGHSFGISNIVEVNATCNGSAWAMVQGLQERGGSMAVTAYEPLGRFTDPEDFASGGIFGSGGASMVLDRNSIKLLSAKTTVIRDEMGVIKVPRTYEINSLEKTGASYPDWLEVREGSEGIVEYSSLLSRLALPVPENNPNFIEMNGSATVRYFAGLVINTLMDGLKSYYQDNPDFAQQNPIMFVAGHQPSKGVFRVVGHKIRKEIVSYNQDRPEKDQLPLDGVMDMPWVLDRARISNVSSATSLVALAELLDRVKKEKTFIKLAYGVGSSSGLLGLHYTR